jgi:hypothetical protein
VRPLLILLATLVIAAVTPSAGMAYMRGPGHFRPSFARFGPRFERPPPRFFRPGPPGPLVPGGLRPAPGPAAAGPAAEPPDHPFADWREQQDTARMEVRQGRFAPLGDVIVNLNRRAPGRLLDTRLTQDGGRSTYHVVWLTEQGRRVEYVVDAASGRVLSER